MIALWWVVMLIMLAIAIALLWHGGWGRRRPAGEPFVDYVEDLSGMPSGLVAYWSAFSDASFLPSAQGGGPWKDLVGTNDLRFDGDAQAPRSDQPGARGFDLAGVSLTGPPSVALLPTAGQDFTVAWVARDPPDGGAGPATLLRLWGNSANNGGLLVAFGPAKGGVRVAAAVGDASAGAWEFPHAVDFRAFALVLHGPDLSLYVDGSRVEPVIAPGPADPTLLWSNKPVRVNPDGAWAGRLAALALWSRALLDTEVSAVSDRLHTEAGDRPRLAASCDARVAQVQAALDASAEAMAALQAQQAAARVDRLAEHAEPALPVPDMQVREGFMVQTLRDESDRVREAALDAVALVNGEATIQVV